ncbi:hypothetical protein [Roseateles sp.]|uniref:hypothetical protein n=1 Tax=Roseateles sp. TaxID=1971397 RepID=UPI0031DC550F
MRIINAYYGPTVLDSIERKLSQGRGDRFDVGVGYARNLTGEVFERFGKALKSWLELDQGREFRLFIGDHRHPMDTPAQSKEKIETCTRVVAALSNYAPSVQERMEVVFLPRLHAKFYSMWSRGEPNDCLEWVIIGSSNLTDAALKEQNIELDIYLEAKDRPIQTIQQTLLAVIGSAYRDGDSWGELHDKIDELTAKTRWENDKLRSVAEWDAEMEAECQAEERREAEKQARLDSDRRLGITGSN